VSRAGLIAGLFAVAVVAYITLNSLTTEGPGSRGVPQGRELPPFAVPLALSDLEGDANVSDRACTVRGPEVLNVCQLAERGPVVLAFFAEPSERCDDEIDVLDRIRSRHPDVQFAAVAVRGDRDDLRRRVRERGWRLPVGHDRDGAVANAYAVAVCPTITFAERGGEIRDTTFGTQTEEQLDAAIGALR
jgi:thiol-disulfide isomerase/thioredoxin